MKLELEQHYQKLFDGLPVMQALTAYPDGIPIVVDCNQHFAATLAYEQEEIVGRPLADFYSPASQAQLDGGGYARSLRGEFLVEEREFVTKDGRVIPTLLRAVPFRNDQGDITGTQAVFIDMSDRKLIEEQLRYQRLLLENMSDAVIGTDEAFIITSWNKAAEKIYGWQASEAIGQNLSKLLKTTYLHGEDHHVARAALYEKGTWRGEISQFRQNNTELFVQTSVSLIKDDEDHIMGIIIFNRDVSVRRQAKMQLQKSLQEKELLLREIHHRVKNNLQMVSSLLDLQLHFVQDDSGLKMFQETQRRVRAMALLHEMLHRTHEVARVNLSEYMVSLTGYLWSSLQAKMQGIGLQLQVEPVLLTMDMAVPCGLILNELITNALKHAFVSGQAGTVTIRIRHHLENNELMMEVKDNGIGLPADFDVTASDSLGLTLIQTLVWQLKGVMTVVTSPETQFIINVPYYYE